MWAPPRWPALAQTVSLAAVRADRQFSGFSADVGIDDSSLERSTRVRFELYGDARLLAESPELAADDRAYHLAADVKGVRVLDLIARDIGGASAPTLIDWAGAAVTP